MTESLYFCAVIFAAVGFLAEPILCGVCKGTVGLCDTWEGDSLAATVGGACLGCSLGIGWCSGLQP